jgi:hypothetical protein
MDAHSNDMKEKEDELSDLQKKWVESTVVITAVMNVHHQNSLELVIIFVPINIFANRLSGAFRYMVQKYLTSL